MGDIVCARFACEPGCFKVKMVCSGLQKSFQRRMVGVGGRVE